MLRQANECVPYAISFTRISFAKRTYLCVPTLFIHKFFAIARVGIDKSGRRYDDPYLSLYRFKKDIKPLCTRLQRFVDFLLLFPVSDAILNFNKTFPRHVVPFSVLSRGFKIVVRAVQCARFAAAGQLATSHASFPQRAGKRIQFRPFIGQCRNTLDQAATFLQQVSHTTDL